MENAVVFINNEKEGCEEEEEEEEWFDGVETT